MRRAVPDRFREPADQYPDDSLTAAEGLQKFDLGMTPASVTPPPTWRRAAWFTVAASAAALGGQILASSVLVAYSRSARDWDPAQRGTATFPSAQRSPVPETALGGPFDEGVQERQPTRLPTVGGVVPHQTPEPRPTCAQPLWPDASDADATLRCDQYFAALRDGDLRGAYAMTAGDLRAEGFAAFAVRYAAASSIEATQVVMEPGRVLTSVRITWADGSVETQRRQLLLSRDENPMILADDRLL